MSDAERERQRVAYIERMHKQGEDADPETVARIMGTGPDRNDPAPRSHGTYPCEACKGTGRSTIAPLADCWPCQGRGFVNLPRHEPGSLGEAGQKLDKDKEDLLALLSPLLPPGAMRSIVAVLEYGAHEKPLPDGRKGYGADNWAKVQPVRYRRAILRHFRAILTGQKNDPETNQPHWAHIGCCVLFLLELER